MILRTFFFLIFEFCLYIFCVIFNFTVMRMHKVFMPKNFYSIKYQTYLKSLNWSQSFKCILAFFSVIISSGDEDKDKHLSTNSTTSCTINDISDAGTLLNILLCSLTDFQSKTKPFGVRNNFLCTLDSRDGKSDDNGAYGCNGTAKKFFFVQFNEAKSES